jgi:hypothetical protein
LNYVVDLVLAHVLSGLNPTYFEQFQKYWASGHPKSWGNALYPIKPRAALTIY